MPKANRELLPVVPARLLGRIFNNLGDEERALALRLRLVPIAWLPHVTLYATAARNASQPASEPGRPIIARIDPLDFERAVDRHWKRDLAAMAARKLDKEAPVFSARQIKPWQVATTLCVFLCLVGSLVAVPLSWVLNSLGVICGTFFLMVTWLRVIAMTESSQPRPDAPERDDARLPVYSVLVPLFRETSVLPQLLQALQGLNYPSEKLDIKLILEETDTEMWRKVKSLVLPHYFEILIVPAGRPQTKPRALNYAMHFARGDLLTIYDAEDIPEPMQLRIAARRFAEGPANLACLQARLAFYNSNENWLTRQFAIEYAFLFRLLLPSLAKLNWPLPLGGTSNHFRVSALRAAGGWDAYNVTEDADLGFRLARLGHLTGTLDSTTYEEASSTPRNWLKQRSRWLKGFLVTWLVHMRNPGGLMRDLGPGGTFALQSALLAVVASAVVHPVFLILLVWKVATGTFAISGAQALLDGYFMALLPVSWAVMVFSSYKALRMGGIRNWQIPLVTMPLYWLCISMASYLALWEFFTARSKWNKTQHGVSRFMQPSKVENPAQR